MKRESIMTVDYENPSATRPGNAVLWTGRVISALLLLFMLGMGTIILLTKPEMMREGMVKYGYPEGAVKWIIVAEFASAILYAIPQTAVLGAILLTGYL